MPRRPGCRAFLGGRHPDGATKDWGAVGELCLLAFAPACQSLERQRGVALDWKGAMGRYLRSLTRPGNDRNSLVAEEV